MSGRRARPGARALLMLLVVAVALVAGPPAVGASTVTIAWQARVGASGANGTVTVAGYASGAGAATLRLARLKASTLLPLVISKGTCAAVGSRIVRLPSVTSTSTGAVARTLSLTAAQLGAIRSASVTGSMTVRVGSSATGGVRCSVFRITTKPPPAAYPGPLAARALFTYYFYWYNETGAPRLNDRPVPDPPTTWRGTAWHATQLMDMAYAGIDVSPASSLAAPGVRGALPAVPPDTGKVRRPYAAEADRSTPLPSWREALTRGP